MRRGKIVLLIVAAILLGLGVFIADAYIGWRPRSALEANFQTIIGGANISDRYGNAGWDREDVTKTVCGSVNVAVLEELGMAKEPIEYSLKDEPSRPMYRWRMMQDKGLADICRTFSNRYLEITIDAETLVCTAIVSALPRCDM